MAGRFIHGRGRYILMRNEEYTDYVGDDVVEIGKIFDTLTEKDVMFIYYNKNNYAECGYHVNIDVYEGENGEFPVASTDDLHRPCFNERPEIFLSMMLHEYGHYVNGDLDQEGLTTDMVKQDRTACICAGRVQETERKADAFAVQYMGKSTFMRFLDYMINKRKQRNEDPRMKELAIKEFELRKRAVRNM